MILSWKILWFQRVWERVLELGALWDKRVRSMHFSFWLCEKKTYSIHFIIEYFHESILVMFISSYWWILTLFRRSVHWRHIPLCVCWTETGGVLLWLVWDYSTAKLWGHVFIFKRVNISARGLTSCHSVFSIYLFVSWAFVVESQFVKARLFDCDVNGQPGRKDTTFHNFNSITAITLNPDDQKHTHNREWCTILGRKSGL